MSKRQNKKVRSLPNKKLKLTIKTWNSWISLSMPAEREVEENQ